MAKLRIIIIIFIFFLILIYVMLLINGVLHNPIVNNKIENTFSFFINIFILRSHE